MDLNSIESVLTPRSRGIAQFFSRISILGGGTWLYSEPQPDVHQLVDIEALGREKSQG
jgi:hypothetical protein